MIPDEKAAEAWWVRSRWPHGVVCPACGSMRIQHRKTRKPQPYRCRDCRKDFSAKTGSLLEGSPLPFQTWAIAIYILTTGIKGTSSMKLHRDLRITQKSAWFLAHRIRETWAENCGAPFTGPVEADETYIGGKVRNMHRKKRRQLEHGLANKTMVAGVLDRRTRKIRAHVVERKDAETLSGFVKQVAPRTPMVYTDEAAAYDRLPNREAVNHGVGQYVDGQAHTNGLESFWSLLKRGYHGTFHRMSPKHLPRYVAEFAGRQNDRPLDTLTQMERIAAATNGKRLKYRTLTRGTGRQRMAE